MSRGRSLTVMDSTGRLCLVTFGSFLGGGDHSIGKKCGGRYRNPPTLYTAVPFGAVTVDAPASTVPAAPGWVAALDLGLHFSPGIDRWFIKVRDEERLEDYWIVAARGRYGQTPVRLFVQQTFPGQDPERILDAFKDFCTARAKLAWADNDESEVLLVG